METLRYLRIMVNSIITRCINFPEYKEPPLSEDYTTITVKPHVMESYEHKLSPSLRARSKAQSSNLP